LIATLAVFLTGCSRNPVAPITGSTAAPDAGPASIVVDQDNVPPVEGGTPIERTVSLTPIDESAVNVGRWTLIIRKNTLRMPATITLRVADPEAEEIELEISPPEAGDFQGPGILVANCSDLQDINYDTATMVVWNGIWQVWNDTVAHQDQQNVSAHVKFLPPRAKLADGDKWKNKLGA
jgi:hypothetical protein